MPAQAGIQELQAEAESYPAGMTPRFVSVELQSA